MKSVCFAPLLALLLAAQSTLATIYVTDPVATTTFTGGQTATISWEDDGATPSLATIGSASVGIYVGSTQQQSLLQMIIGSVDVSTTASIQFTVDPTIGPDGDYYFVRFTSLGYNDPTNPAYKYEQFSARFTLTGMTGTFNATVQGEVNGATGANAIAGATSTPSHSASVVTQTSVVAAGAPTAASASAKASTTPSGTAKSAAFPRVSAPSSGAAYMGAFLALTVLVLAL